MTPQQFLLILWARKRMILVVFVITVAATLTVSLVMPRQYTASVSVVVDVKADPIAGTLLPGVASPNYMTTQTEIIQSDRVAMGVVKLLHLEQSAPAVARWKEDKNNSKLPFEYYYGTLLQKALVVTPPRGSNIIVITFTGLDPGFAAAVANAFAQSYINVAIDLRVEPARQYAAFFEERRKSLREALEKAQSRLSAYQQQKGIVATDSRLDQETTRLNSLNAQLSEIQGQKIESTSRQKNTGSELSPDVQQNPVIISLKNSLNVAEARLSEISTTVGPSHPQRQQLEAQIQELRQQLNQEIRRISGSAATSSRAAGQKEQELKALIEAQKKRVLGLRDEHDEISVLAKEVDAAQAAYDAVSQRMSLTSLESKSEQTNLSILSPAMPPTAVSRPNVLKNLLASLAGGLMLGIALAMGVEYLDRRVRNADDLAVADGVPLLGVLQPEVMRYTVKERLSIAMKFLRAWRKQPGAAEKAAVT